MNLATLHTVYVSLLLFLCQQILATEDECYCNKGSDCVDNRCPQNDPVVQCSVEVIKRNGSFSLQYLCLDGLLSCLSSPSSLLPSDCCMGHLCNRCLVPPDLTYHMAVDVVLPEGCPQLNITPTTTEPPTLSEETSTHEITTTVTEASGSSLSTPFRIAIYILSSLVLILVTVLSAIIIIVCLCRRQKQRVRKVNEIEDGESIPPYDFSYRANDDVSRPDSSGAMTGNRKGQLEQRTITRIVKKKHLIAKGGFGEVWYGVWDDKPVAIKVFSPLGEDSWKKEEEIYRTNMLNHDHILRVMACDSYTNAFGIEHWLIMEYHDSGSLCEYIQRNTLSVKELQRILYTISDGLSFLHKPVTTSYARSQKPGIAHRDLKTRNILVKRDRTCCIADLGLAVRSSDFESVETLPKPQQGTKRILAPEILDDTINRTQFQSYCQADVYSMGLVMWECARRTEIHGEVLEYELPYQNSVSKDPSFEDMRRVVVDSCIRPPIDVRWKQNTTLSVISTIMQECWRHNPEGRLSTARIKKKIQSLSLQTKNHLSSLSSMKLDGDMSLTTTQMSFQSHM